MSTRLERILIVEDNAEISSMIARQTLQPLGYTVGVVRTAAAAIQEVSRFTPDVLIVNLKLPDLSGKDLLVALSSQGLEVPIIVLSEVGFENDIIQAFRLGASEYLFWPAGEAEMISVIERVLRQVRSKREREMLSRQLNQTNQELQRRVRELTTIFALGKAVTSITDQQALFDKIVEGAVYVSEAECGWLLLRQEQSRAFLLSAQRNLPESIASQVNKPWDDGISSLVGVSGESLSVHGEPLKRFKISRLGQSILIVPVKVKSEVFGLLVVLRKTPRPFSSSNQALLEAVADYASISLANARLFKVLDERVRAFHQAAEAAQARERSKDESLKKIRQELNIPLRDADQGITALLSSENEQLNPAQVDQLRTAQEKLMRVLQKLENLEKLN